MNLSKDPKARLIAIYLLVAVLVGAVGYGFDRLLARDGFGRTEVLVASNGLTGLVTAYLFYALAAKERVRRELFRERLRIVAEMNHHIRNALQVITYAAASGQNDESVELIRSSVDRIEWALREVLPGRTSSDAVPEQKPAQERMPPRGELDPAASERKLV